MVDKRCDPKVGDFGYEFWPLLEERLAKFVVFLFNFENFLTRLLVQSGQDQKQTLFHIYSQTLILLKLRLPLNSFNKVQHTCRFHSVLHRCARWLLAALFLNKKTVLDNNNSKYLNAFLSPNNNKLAQQTLKYTYLQFTRFPTNTVSFKHRTLSKIPSNNPYYYYYHHLYIFCDVHALRGSRANAAWFKCERNRAAPASAKNASPPDARLKSLQR